MLTLPVTRRRRLCRGSAEANGDGKLAEAGAGDAAEDFGGLKADGTSARSFNLALNRFSKFDSYRLLTSMDDA